MPHSCGKAARARAPRLRSCFGQGCKSANTLAFPDRIRLAQDVLRGRFMSGIGKTSVSPSSAAGDAGSLTDPRAQAFQSINAARLLDLKFDFKANSREASHLHANLLSVAVPEVGELLLYPAGEPRGKVLMALVPSTGESGEMYLQRALTPAEKTAARQALQNAFTHLDRGTLADLKLRFTKPTGKDAEYFESMGRLEAFLQLVR
jgi:hypothetical protein